MHHAVTCHSSSPTESGDSAELTVDVDHGRTEVTVTGVAGPRAVSALRAMLDGLDGVREPIHLISAFEPGSDLGIDAVVQDARTSRRRRGLSDILVHRREPDSGGFASG